jgi:hypothetical protein
MYGRTENEWEEMREAAERFLISAAEKGGMTDYGVRFRRKRGIDRLTLGKSRSVRR